MTWYEIGGVYFGIVIAGFLILLSIAWEMWSVRTYKRLQSYQAGRCTIIAKQLLQEQSSTPESTWNGTIMLVTRMNYRPEFEFLVQTAEGQEYRAQGYDALNRSSCDRDSQQAIIDQYTVGEPYPCWYDPTDPTRAVLTQHFNRWEFLVPVLMLLSGVGIVIWGISHLF